MDGYGIVEADKAEDSYAGSDVPGEFRKLTEALGAEQLAVTLIRIPPHSDFEQGSGHFHEEIEELYLVTRGRLTMRFGEEPVEMWAVSRQVDHGDATKVDDFWQASSDARQTR